MVKNSEDYDVEQEKNEREKEALLKEYSPEDYKRLMELKANNEPGHKDQYYDETARKTDDLINAGSLTDEQEKQERKKDLIELMEEVGKLVKEDKKHIPELQEIRLNFKKEFPEDYRKMFNQSEFKEKVDDNIDNKNNDDSKSEKIKKAIKSFTDMLDLADQFIDIQPLYYDMNKIWWIWNFETYSWDMTDEVQWLNMLDKEMNQPFFTINSRNKNEIIESLKRRARLRKPKNPEKYWIQFKDTVVDIKSGDVFSASPEYFFTSAIPYSIGETEDTPTMDKLFNEWVVGGNQDQSYVDTMYEIIAYSTLRDQFLQRLFAFTGIGSNGKGCFLSIVAKFLGEENIYSTELKELINNRFETSALLNKQAVFMGEVDVYDMSNTNLLKKLTGEDKIRYELKGKQPFSDHSFCTCFMATNSLPMTPDKSDGFYRRWLLIEFPNQFKVGKNIVSQIPEEEYNNLARKIINIIKGLYDNMKFTNDGDIDERKKIFEQRSDPMIRFINLHCKESAEKDLKFSDFCLSFYKYLKDERLREISKRKIGQALRSEGYLLEKVNVIRADGTRTKVLMIMGFSMKNTPKTRKYYLLSYTLIGKLTKIQHFGVLQVHLYMKEIQNLLKKPNRNVTCEDIFLENDEIKGLNSSKDLSLPSWDEKAVIWRNCCICRDTPCNESDGQMYCQKHFKNQRS